MYHKIGIQRLSPTQISKLLNGHKIRVKHGQGHEIHASAEQHKKIMTAHRKGKAHTMQFDPYQMAQHQHLRHGHRSHGEGEGMKHAVHHAHKHHAHMHHGYGEGEGEGFFGSIARAVAPTLIDYGANALKSRLGHGEGMKHRGRPRKHAPKHHASMGEGRAVGRRRRGKGEGMYSHHLSHGEALYPAGYGMMPIGIGEGMKRRGRKSKGEGMLGSTLGGLAGSFLPF